jgi:hypothetical protein
MWVSNLVHPVASRGREGGNYRPQRNSSSSFRIKFEQEREQQQQRVLSALIFSSSCFAFSSLFLGICLFSSLLFHVLLPLGSPLYEIPFLLRSCCCCYCCDMAMGPTEREIERENSEEKGIHPVLFLQVLLLLRDSWKQGSQYTHTHNTKLERN